MTSINARMDRCQRIKLEIEALAPQEPNTEVDIRIAMTGGVAKATGHDDVRKLTISLDISNEEELFYRIKATAEAVFHFDEASDPQAILEYIEGDGWRMAMTAVRTMLDSVTALFPNGTIGLPDIDPARRLITTESSETEQ